ncbi:MAG: hypothetical protein C0609_03625 [Deltaproteobacteria bacterium]|nr:MAG: hypothetical protein C0609_03625 [Deltaproteobacteria bacterium]
MRIKSTPILVAFLALIMAVGCASQQSPDYYRRGQAQGMQKVIYGTVVEVRNVMIEGTKTPVGTVVGGIAGAIVGSTIGRGAGRQLATVAGATAGAVGGSVAEEKITQKEGVELTIDLDRGETVAVVQEISVEFYPGDRVRLVEDRDGTTKAMLLGDRGLYQNNSVRPRPDQE